MFMHSYFYGTFLKLKFEPLPVADGECFCDNYQRTPVSHGRKRSVRYEVQQQSSFDPDEAPISVHVHARVTVDLSFCLGLLLGAAASLIGMCWFCKIMKIF